MIKSILVPIADGTEELEAVTIIDILRRAGTNVIVAGIDKHLVTASRGVRLMADSLITDCNGEVFDMIVLPGGMPGAEHLRDSVLLTEMLKKQESNSRWIAAICASPVVVLQHHGLLENRKATCHPARKKDLLNQEAADLSVVVDGNCITGRGPGTAIEFSLKLVEVLYGKKKMLEVSQPLAGN